MLARAYVADAIADVVSPAPRPRRRRGASTPRELAPALRVRRGAPRAGVPRGARRAVREARHRARPTSSDDFELVADTFRRFADDKIRPVAEHVHRTNADVPEEIIAGLAELGGFGLSVPEEYGGFATGGESGLHRHGRRHRGAVARLARHRRLARHAPRDPHACARRGRHRGAEAARGCRASRAASSWSAIMVTEPDYGSDVAGVKVTATPADGGWLVNGVKTWATFAGPRRRAHAARPHRPRPHEGPPRACRCSIVEKPRAEGHAFAFDDGRGGKMEGRAIDTIGYRGMHSYEVAFDNWFVPADEPHRRRRRARPGLLPPDGGLRERPAADRGARGRAHAGRVRGRARRTRRNARCSGSRCSTTSCRR